MRITSKTEKVIKRLAGEKMWTRGMEEDVPRESYKNTKAEEEQLDPL